MYNSVFNPLAITFFKSVIIFSKVIILFLIVAIDYVEEKDYLLQREGEEPAILPLIKIPVASISLFILVLFHD